MEAGSNCRSDGDDYLILMIGERLGGNGDSIVQAEWPDSDCRLGLCVINCAFWGGERAEFSHGNVPAQRQRSKLIDTNERRRI